MPKGSGQDFLKHLTSSKIYQDYEKAFSETTRMPVSLRTTDSWNISHRGNDFENPFCAILAKSSRSCAACLDIQQKLSDVNQDEPKTVTCFAGLTDSSVPVRLGSDLVGFLQTGQVALKRPTRAQFNRITKQLIQWGVKIDFQRLEEAYFQTRVLSQKQYRSMLKLLEIFAQHLSIVSNQIVLQQKSAEPPGITKAKEYIQEHKSEDLSLAEVSKAINVSTFYFCKMFKKATGLNFTEYLSRIRIEKAKNLLLNPNLRISEIAYEVGFQSLTHFNRVFRRISGQSPSSYRESLPKI